jgi:hypothetical protein
VLEAVRWRSTSSQRDDGEEGGCSGGDGPSAVPACRAAVGSRSFSERVSVNAFVRVRKSRRRGF